MTNLKSTKNIDINEIAKTMKNNFCGLTSETKTEYENESRWAKFFIAQWNFDIETKGMSVKNIAKKLKYGA